MFFKNNFNIGKKQIGEKYKSLIVAEISANHNNNYETYEVGDIMIIMRTYKLV